MDFELKIGLSNITKSTYKIPGNQSLLNPISTQSSTFALMLDGPEFLLNEKNSFIRRLRLLCDGWTVMTARYHISGTENSYMEPATFVTSTAPFYGDWGDPFEVFIRVDSFWSTAILFIIVWNQCTLMFFHAFKDTHIFKVSVWFIKGNCMLIEVFKTPLIRTSFSRLIGLMRYYWR